MPKRAESLRCEVNTSGKTCLEYVFQGLSKENFLGNRLQNLNGLTDFSEEKI